MVGWTLFFIFKIHLKPEGHQTRQEDFIRKSFYNNIIQFNSNTNYILQNFVDNTTVLLDCISLIHVDQKKQLSVRTVMIGILHCEGTVVV